MIPADRTAKLTLEGDPQTVAAITARLQQYFTVTYISKNQRLATHPTNIRCYLRLLPPAMAHQTEQEQPQ